MALSVDSTGATIAVIIAMALVAYGTRAGGLWLMGHVTLTPRVQAFLDHLPGSILISLVLPAVIKAGPIAAIGVTATVAIVLLTGRSLLAIAAAVGVVVAIRALI